MKINVIINSIASRAAPPLIGLLLKMCLIASLIMGSQVSSQNNEFDPMVSQWVSPIQAEAPGGKWEHPEKSADGIHAAYAHLSREEFNAQRYQRGSYAVTSDSQSSDQWSTWLVQEFPDGINSDRLRLALGYEKKSLSKDSYSLNASIGRYQGWLDRIEFQIETSPTSQGNSDWQRVGDDTTDFLKFVQLNAWNDKPGMFEHPLSETRQIKRLRTRGRAPGQFRVVYHSSHYEDFIVRPVVFETAVFHSNNAPTQPQILVHAPSAKTARSFLARAEIVDTGDKASWIRAKIGHLGKDLFYHQWLITPKANRTVSFHYGRNFTDDPFLYREAYMAWYRANFSDAQNDPTLQSFFTQYYWQDKSPSSSPDYAQNYHENPEGWYYQFEVGVYDETLEQTVIIAESERQEFKFEDIVTDTVVPMLVLTDTNPDWPLGTLTSHGRSFDPSKTELQTLNHRVEKLVDQFPETGESFNNGSAFLALSNHQGHPVDGVWLYIPSQTDPNSPSAFDVSFQYSTRLDEYGPETDVRLSVENDWLYIPINVDTSEGELMWVKLSIASATPQPLTAFNINEVLFSIRPPVVPPIELDLDFVDLVAGETYLSTELSPLAISVSGLDPDSGVSIDTLTLSVDGVLVASATSPFNSFDWDPQVGERTLTTIATLSNGQVFEESISITIEAPVSGEPEDPFGMTILRPELAQGAPGMEATPYRRLREPMDFGELVGDPVRLKDGAFLAAQPIMALGGAGIPINIVLSYTSRSQVYGQSSNSIGQEGWIVSYDMCLKENYFGDVDFWQEDGQVYRFNSNDNGTYVKPRGAMVTLLDLGDRWVMNFRDGNTLRFDEEGVLYEVEDRLGNRIQISFDPLTGIKTYKNNRTDQAIELVHKKITRADGSSAWRLSTVCDATANRLADDPTPLRSARIIYNGAGQLTGISDASGRLTTFTYGPDGFLVGRRDQEDTGVDITYLTASEDLFRRVSQETLTNGNSISYDWQDAAGRLVVSYESEGETRDMTYAFDIDDSGLNTGRVAQRYVPKGGLQPERRVSLNTYNENFQLSSISNVFTGASMEMDYNLANGDLDGVERFVDGNTKGTIDLNRGNFGAVTQSTRSGDDQQLWQVNNTYNAGGLPIEREGNDGRKTIYTYLSSGLPKTMVTPNGIKTTFEYNDLGFPISSKVEAPGTEDVVVETEFDFLGRPLQQSSTTGLVTTWEYNDTTYELLSVTSVRGQEERRTEYVYDDLGRLVEIISDPEGAAATTTFSQWSQVGIQGGYVPLETEYPDGSKEIREFNAFGDLLLSKSLSADGKFIGTRTEYDEAGRVLGVYQVAEDDSERQLTRFEYDEIGRLVASGVASAQDDHWLMTRVTIDPLGLVTEKILEVLDGSDQVIESHSVATTHDLLDRPDQVSNFDGTSRSYTYNDEHLALEEIVRQDEIKTTISYDPESLYPIRQTSGKNESQVVGNTQYDTFGRQTQVWRGGSTTPESAVGLAYDHSNSLNKPSEVTDSFGHTTKFEYNIEGQISKITDALNQVTTYEYDGLGWLAEANLPLGQRTTYSYDLENREVVLSDPTGTERWLRRPDGQLAEYTDQASRKTIYSYDKWGQLIETTILVDGVPEWRSTHEYSQNGALIAVNDFPPLGQETGRTEYVYNHRGQITERTRDGRTLTYLYDDLGRHTGTRYWNGEEVAVTSRYDDGKVETLSLFTSPDDKEISPSESAHFAYDDYGTPVMTRTLLIETENEQSEMVEVETALVTHHKRNIKGETESIEQSIDREDSDDFSIDYTYDGNGRISTKTNDMGTSSYIYDALSRLSTEFTPEITLVPNDITYTYNGAGDMTAVEYAVGPNGESWNISSGSSRILSGGVTYDRAGAITSTGEAPLSRQLNVTYEGLEARATSADISADGRYIAMTIEGEYFFKSAYDAQGRKQVYLLDQLENRYYHVSATRDGRPPNGNSKNARVSSDGRYVTFISEATNLNIAEGSPGGSLHRWDRHTGLVTRFPNTYSLRTEIDASDDGKRSLVQPGFVNDYIAVHTTEDRKVANLLGGSPTTQTTFKVDPLVKLSDFSISSDGTWLTTHADFLDRSQSRKEKDFGFLVNLDTGDQFTLTKEIAGRPVPETDVRFYVASAVTNSGEVFGQTDIFDDSGFYGDMFTKAVRYSSNGTQAEVLQTPSGPIEHFDYLSMTSTPDGQYIAMSTAWIENPDMLGRDDGFADDVYVLTRAGDNLWIPTAVSLDLDLDYGAGTRPFFGDVGSQVIALSHDGRYVVYIAEDFGDAPQINNLYINVADPRAELPEPPEEEPGE